MRKKIILLAGILAMLSSCNVVRTTGTVAANTAYSVAAVPVVLPIAAVAAVGSAAEKLKPKENENPEKADELEARLRAELVANPEQALMADIEQSENSSESESDFE